MVVVVFSGLWLSRNWADIFKLLLIVPSAAAAYWLAAKILHIEMLSLLTSRQKSPAEN